MLEPVFFDRLDQIEEIIENSKNPNFKGVFVFKHSTSCFISKTVYRNLQAEWNIKEPHLFYYLDLLKHRAISNQVSEVFEVVHESPQILYINQGKCLKSASHGAIQADLIEDWMNE